MRDVHRVNCFPVLKGEEIRIDESAWSIAKRDGLAYFDEAGKLHMLPEDAPAKSSLLSRWRSWLFKKEATK